MKKLILLLIFISSLSYGQGYVKPDISTPLTTKGDIFIFSTVTDRLPVGTNGQILSAESSESSGLKWIASPTLQSITDTGATTTNPIAITNNSFEQLKVSNTAGSDAIIATTAGSNTAGYLKLTNEDGGVMNLTIRHDQVNTNTVTVPAATGRAAVIGTTAPASASATGVEGEVRVTSTYIYHCIATDTWVRSVAATW